jgi:hypothetical protein
VTEQAGARDSRIARRFFHNRLSVKDLRGQFFWCGKISLTPNPSPRILKSRDALFSKAVAVFYFWATPRL